MEVRWEFFFPKSGRKYSHANSYNFSKALISQDDYLTAGAWAACGISEWEYGNGGGGVVGTAEGRSGERIVSSLLMYKVKAGDAVWANKMRTSWKLNSSNININVFPSVSIHFKMGTSYHLVSWKTRCERDVRRKLFWYQALSWDTTHPHSPHSLDTRFVIFI